VKSPPPGEGWGLLAGNKRFITWKGKAQNKKKSAPVP